MSEQSELVALERNLKAALDAFKAAEQAESCARKARCDAQNTLNTAQRQFDAYVNKLRSSAPRESDWGTTDLRPVRQVAA